MVISEAKFIISIMIASIAEMFRGGGRPAVIVSNDIGNNAGLVLEVVYLTTQEKKPLPTHVRINSSRYPSTVLCEQIATINKEKVGKYIGQCSMAEMKRIDEAIGGQYRNWGKYQGKCPD